MAKDSAKNINADEDFTKPGEALRKKNPDAHAATYDEAGDLLIKTVKPVAAVEGRQEGTAETHVDAKIQEPVSGAIVEPKDTVEVPEAIDHNKPETVEVRDDSRTDLKDGDESPASKQAKKDTEAVIDALDIDKTEAAKNSEESVKEAKKQAKSTK